MLSRVAERIYWLARYLERAENTARLVSTYHFLLLDLPKGAQVGWRALPVITGGRAQFAERYPRADERNTLRFLLADAANPGSLANSVAWARENFRTSREELPGEAWERINELHLFVTEGVASALARGGRFEQPAAASGHAAAGAFGQPLAGSDQTRRSGRRWPAPGHRRAADRHLRHSRGHPGDLVSGVMGVALVARVILGHGLIAPC